MREIIFAYKSLVKENHDNVGHPGIRKTYERIKERYQVPDLMKKIEERIKQCETFETSKVSTRTKRKEEPVIFDTPIQNRTTR